MQAHVGKRDRMEQFGRRVIRDHLPEQHREFYGALPHLVAGSVDGDGNPWASILTGAPGFVTSPTDRLLAVDGGIVEGDPLADTLAEGQPLGFLGLQFETRRRNRVNGRVVEHGGDRLLVGVDQAFGNCPQYIQTRSLTDAKPPRTHASVLSFETLTDAQQDWIASSDTFFVASAAVPDGDARVQGVDVSHRGGRPGFVRVEGDRLMVPDFSGNNHFNTLGNFLVYPKAGLLFVDFERGNILMLTGEVEIHLDPAEVAEFEGAERFWSFTLTKGLQLSGALPIRWALEEASPRNARTGCWPQVADT